MSNELNLTIIALVALVAIVGLVALVMNAGKVPSVAIGSQLASAQPSSLAQDPNVTPQDTNATNAVGSAKRHGATGSWDCGTYVEMFLGLIPLHLSNC